MQNSELDSFTKMDGKTKPVLIRFVDGGPDQNPHNAKVIAAAIEQFMRFEADVSVVASNAPGRSSFNPVERRMAPLSKSLVGVLLPHDKCGNHLDAQQRTINVALEKENFEYAGNVLAEIWSGIVFDSFKTYAYYIEPTESDITDPERMTQEWIAQHCRFSQYLLQIVKCDNKKCCKKFRSNWMSVVPSRFLPPPIRISNHTNGSKNVKLRI